MGWIWDFLGFFSVEERGEGGGLFMAAGGTLEGDFEGYGVKMSTDFVTEGRNCGRLC